jgi:hypothetical protein
MSINYIPLESKSGFKSPGFSVNEVGDLVVDGAVLFNSQLNVAPDFTVNGILIIDATDSIVALGDGIKHSSLTKLGTLENLQIDGDFTVAQGSTPYVSIVNGHVEINSVAGVGSIDNMDIGLKDPRDANFKSVNIGPGDSTGELTVQGNASITIDLTVTGDISASDISAADISAGDIVIANAPTAINHATRKDYVDSRATAFAVAFGA